nr:immunoglobulin heavy chain junction region [Mus musculus]
CTGGYYAMDYW